MQSVLFAYEVTDPDGREIYLLEYFYFYLRAVEDDYFHFPRSRKSNRGQTCEIT